MGFKKWILSAALLMALALSACNLSQSAASGEVALNPPTVEVRPTRTPIPFNNPTVTPFAAPTITVLGGNDVAAQPASQVVDVASVPTQPPPSGICSLKPSGNFDVNVRLGPGASFGIVTALRTGKYAPVLSRSDGGWFRIDLGTSGQGWVSPKVVTLFGPCTSLPVDVVAASQGIQAASASLTPTPTAQFGFTMNIPLNHLVTKVTVGDIPANTTVTVTTTQFTGKGYIYSVVTADGRYANATDSQLAYSETGGALPFPTPTITPPFVPTPTALFSSELGMGVYRVMTTTTVGSIPAGTAVRVGWASFDGTKWSYQITTKDESQSATAYESQLAYIPNAGGGGPTPTVAVVATPTIPVMDLATDVSPTDVVIPTDMCTVTATSATNLVATPGSSAVMGVLNPGPWAQVGATNGQGWYKVTNWVNGSQGWASTNTLTLHGPCDNLPVESTGA